MSKRYVIQVATSDAGAEWQTVQHPAGGDWKTRSRSTAIADAARLVHDGETRELRIGISRPVYTVTPDVTYGSIVTAAQEINFNELIESDTDDHDDDDDDDTPKFETVKYENYDGTFGEMAV